MDNFRNRIPRSFYETLSYVRFTIKNLPTKPREIYHEGGFSVRFSVSRLLIHYFIKRKLFSFLRSDLIHQKMPSDFEKKLDVFSSTSYQNNNY